MANKRVKEKRMIDNKAMAYEKERASLLHFYIISAAIALVAVLCYFFNWVYVDNADYGIEVKVGGFSFVAAAIAGNYTSTQPIFGDLAVPFFYYAATECQVLGILTIIALIADIGAIALLIVTRITKKQQLSLIALPLTIISAVLLFVVFGIALGMKNGDILSVYCGGNPKCSIGSLAIIAAIVTLASAVLQGYTSVKYVLCVKKHAAR